MKTFDKYISDILKEVESLKKRDPNCNIAFRGESKDYGRTKLMPSIFRNSEYIQKEKQLFQLLKDYRITDAKASYTDMLIEAQHYVAISRVLDITFSIIPALFFACQTNFDDVGKIYVFGFPEYISPHSEFIEKYYKGGYKKAYIHNFKVISHAQENERIISQKGGFVFFQGTAYVPINPIYYKDISINPEDKKDIIEKLYVLFGENKATLFPERGIMAEDIVKPKFSEITATEDDISIYNEIKSAFERIRYEAKMEKIEGTFDAVSFGRRLRKEKLDLKNYIYELSEDNEVKEKLLQSIDTHYLLLGGL